MLECLSHERPATERTILAERWDAGETGCGRLIFELHVRLKRMRPGETIEVTARDPGAPADLPAWCRTTGHTLVSADHPVYVIRRKGS
jgi:tRNA 2-thiouridine synthesizing protein A